MTIVALAIESNISLSNSVVVAYSPEKAVDKLVRCLDIMDGEEIHLICADVLPEEGVSDEEANDFRAAVERLFEQAVPELFAPGYFGDEE